MNATIAVDYPVLGQVAVASTAQLRDALRGADAGRPVRLLGGGSRQDRLPAPRVPPVLVSLGGLRAIRRLEPDDLTCSVEPGLPRAELDAALAEVGLCLPCDGGGTLGGAFAAGDDAPRAPGAFSTRALLLGLEGMLADGTEFRAGARVVKSVAGFDLQKLFTGSRGALFAVTLLHLKLRPRPRGVLEFACVRLEREPALALWRRLRLLPLPPVALYLERRNGGFAVRGRCESTPRMLEDLARSLELERGPAGSLAVPAAAGAEVVGGFVRPTRAPELLALLPAAAHVVISGTGQFETALAPHASDALLAALPALEATGELRAGAAARRGLATPGDATATRLMRGLKEALDPMNLLA